MIVRGGFLRKSVEAEMARWKREGAVIEELEAHLVERGKVYRVTFSNGKTLLILTENAKIKMHNHLPECCTETYSDVYSGAEETCAVGQSHYLENVGLNSWALVWAKKCMAS